MARDGEATKIQTWSGIILLIVVAMLIGVYFLWTSYKQAMSEPDLSIAVRISPQKSNTNAALIAEYRSDDYHFSLQYPKNWQAKTVNTGEGNEAIFSLSLSDEGQEVGVSVMSASLEGMVRNSVSIVTESAVEISGLPAQKLDGGSAKDGSAVTLFLLKKNEILYSIRGQGTELSQITGSFRILQ